MNRLSLLIAAALVMLSPLTLADDPHTTSGSNTNTNTATGGNGGAGGAGGSVAFSGNSNVTTHTTNNLSNHQQQQQGQIQGQQQSIKNSGNSSNHNNNNASVSKSGNSMNSYVSEAQKRNPVASAASNFLAASGDCIGSIGVSGQFIGFGASVGGTKDAPDCNRRADAAYWHKAGKPVIAMARMCQDDANRQAVHDAGELCPDEGTVKVVAGRTYIEGSLHEARAKSKNPNAYVADPRWPSTRSK